MIEYTPGPWKVLLAETDPYEPIKIAAKHRHICELWLDDAPVHDFNREQQANANLIAAAPNMLEVLEAFVEEAATNAYSPGCEHMGPLVIEARKIIAEIKGNSHGF